MRGSQVQVRQVQVTACTCLHRLDLIGHWTPASDLVDFGRSGIRSDVDHVDSGGDQ